jgi:hypothetical protein
VLALEAPLDGTNGLGASTARGYRQPRTRPDLYANWYCLSKYRKAPFEVSISAKSFVDLEESLQVGLDFVTTGIVAGLACQGERSPTKALGKHMLLSQQAYIGPPEFAKTHWAKDLIMVFRPNARQVRGHLIENGSLGVVHLWLSTTMLRRRRVRNVWRVDGPRPTHLSNSSWSVEVFGTAVPFGVRI